MGEDFTKIFLDIERILDEDDFSGLLPDPGNGNCDELGDRKKERRANEDRGGGAMVRPSQMNPGLDLHRHDKESRKQERTRKQQPKQDRWSLEHPDRKL